MRIAVAGKGGAGKTTITATLARLAAEAGRRVVCIDADSNPNLSVALGIADGDVPDALPVGVVSRRLDGGPALTEPVHDLLARHGTVGPAGIRLALMGMPGHAEEGCMCSAHAVVRGALADLADDILTLVDMEASPEHLSRGTARHVDALLLVAEPYFRSLETVRRMAELAAELPIPRVGVVGNKLRDDADREAVAAFCERHDLELLAEVPWDDRVLDADRDRVPLAEATPGSAAVGAIRQLVGLLGSGAATSSSG